MLMTAACSDSGTATDVRIPIQHWDVQGHRGARGIRPENTLPSFEAALDAGVTTLELDVHLSADDVPVIWHDPRIDPAKCSTTDLSLPAADVEPRLRTLTAAQLATYRCDVNPDPDTYPEQQAAAGVVAGDAYGIAQLEDLFTIVETYAQSPDKNSQQRDNAAQVQFNIELKRDPRNPAAIGDSFDGVGPAEFENAVAEIVEKWGYQDRVIVQSFDHRSLWAFHSLAPDIRLAALTVGYVPDFAALATAGATIWSPRYSALTPDRVAAAHAAGLDVIPWTVNDADEVCTLLAMGTDGVITDRPDLALGDAGWLHSCT
jgi:glycerophosphoryl diester phosphodiesterase